MNRSQWKDLFREIRKSRGRYLSLLFIVALGTAFYAGVRSSEPDMMLSADRYYDETNLMDVWVMGTLGLTEDDVDAIAETEGILLAEGAYSAEVFAVCEDDMPIIDVVSAGTSLNQMTIEEGRMPQSTDECFMDQLFMTEQGYEVGDTVTVVSEDGDCPENLVTDTFTIVGCGTWSWYLSWDRGSASIGDGSVDAFMVLMPEAFDQDYYSVIYALVDGAEELNTFSDAYDDAVALVTDRLEEIAGERCEIRYTEVYADSEKELEEGRQEIADAWAELDEAKQELEDGEQEYADGLAEYEDGLQSYEEAQQEIADAEQTLADSRQQLDEGQEQYEEGLAAIAAAVEELNASRALLEDSISQLTAAQAELDEAQSQVDEQTTSLDEQAAQVAAGLAACEEGEQELAAAQAQIEEKEQELTAGQSAYEAGLAEYEAGAAQLAAAKAQLDDGWEQIEAAQAELDALAEQLEQVKAVYGESSQEYQTLYAQWSAGTQQLEALREALSAQQAEYDAAAAELAASKAVLDETASTLESGSQELAAAKAQLDAQAQELASTKAQLEEAQSQITQGYAALDAAQSEIDEGTQTLQESASQVEAGSQELADGEAQLADSEQQLADSAQELADGETAYAEAVALLEESRKELEEAGQELEDAKAQLEEARQELDDGWEEYEEALAEAEPELEDAQKEIDDGEEALAELEVPEWYVLDRNSVQSSVEYGMDAGRIGAIGDVFPTLFFLVAALVSLTTMTRMIEEERTLIGTMKALGYGKLSISGKYILYALSATMAGSVFGVILGSWLLPYVIMTAYGMLYTNVQYMLMPLHADICIFSILIAVICTVGAAFAACYRTLMSTPASLMRPPSPKKGRRVFLEHLPFIWKRLNFSMKSTVRNLMRYKKRLFMTVFGIGSCMALLLVSFGLHDSIAAIVDNQYQSIWIYAATCGVDSDDTLEEQQEMVNRILEEDPDIESGMLARQSSVDVSSGSTEKTVYLYVMEDMEKSADYLDLHDRITGESYELTDDGAVITEKLASILDVEVGDSITLQIDDTTRVEIPVTAVVENYLYHYVYLTPTFYEEIYGEEPVYNELFLQFTDGVDTSEKAEYLLSQDEITSVSLVEELQATVDDMMNALNLVVWVLVISAGLLVFVVIYNLNNINISERRRELASLKVLGFYDTEVAMYVYRENIFLTILGLIAGVFLGTWLHRYMILTLEVDMIMFGRNITLASYLYSIILTVVFAIAVNLGMFSTLQKIDMVESLKSVE